MALLSNIITPSNVLKDSSIGTTVQAYDADTTKNDVANTFTANQKIYGTGRDLLTLQTSDNLSSRGIAFQNSGTSYIGFIGMEDAGGNLGNLSFATASTVGIFDPASITEIRMSITPNGGVSFGSSGTAYGTSGQALISNGNAPPSWGEAGISTGKAIAMAIVFG